MKQSGLLVGWLALLTILIYVSHIFFDVGYLMYARSGDSPTSMFGFSIMIGTVGAAVSGILSVALEIVKRLE